MKSEQPFLLAAFSAVLMGGMAFFTKLLTKSGVPATEVAFFRFALGLIPLFWVRASFRPLGRVDLVLYRCFFGSVAVVLYFLGIQHGTVGGATLLNSTAPIFAGVFAALFLRERVSRRVLLPMAVTLGGVVLTANSFPGGFGRWEFVALCSAVASAGAVTAMRAARRSEGVWTVYASMTFSGALITAPFAVNSWRTPSLSQASLLVTMSAFAFGGQALMMRSLRWVSAMTIGIIAQLAVVVSMLLGYVVLGEPMTLRLIAGALITIGGVIGVIAVMARATQSTPAAVVSMTADDRREESRAA